MALEIRWVVTCQICTLGLGTDDLLLSRLRDHLSNAHGYSRNEVDLLQPPRHDLENPTATHIIVLGKTKVALANATRV